MNKSFSHFYNTINHVVNKHAPLSDASVRKLEMLTKPWLTARLRKSLKVKNILLFESNWPKYKMYRNKLTTLRVNNVTIKVFSTLTLKICSRNRKVLTKYWETRHSFTRPNGHSFLSDDPKTIDNTLN